MNTGVSTRENALFTNVALGMVLLTVLGLFACASSGDSSEGRTADSDTTTVLITLERTVCFGFCPEYRLALHGDGRVEYEGIRNVATLGRRTAAINGKEVRILAASLVDSGYFDLNNRYENRRVTDMPSVLTSVRIGNRVKSISHYMGDFSAPESLSAMENAIDSVARSKQWIEE